MRKLKVIAKAVRQIKFDVICQLSRLRKFKDRCCACGYQGNFRFEQVLWPELVCEWNLDSDCQLFFNEREGKCCPHCGCSLRVNVLAVGVSRALKEFYGVDGASLHATIKQLRASKITNVLTAEINSAGGLHRFLQGLPNLIYSEYGSTIDDIRSENIQDLTFADSSVNIVITSEVLEHVPDPVAAFEEIHRVLVPGGVHVFTIPVHPTRDGSVCRAKIEQGKIIHLQSPSYHGGPNNRNDDFLVFHEFGNDIYNLISVCGFSIERITLPGELNPTAFCLFTRKI